MKYIVDYYPHIYQKNTDLIYFIGVKNFSFNMAKEYDKEEVIKILTILKQDKQPSIINLERLFFEEELVSLKEFLSSIKDLVCYISYSDYGLYNIAHALNIKTIFHASTIVTSSFDANEILNFSDLWLGKELSLDEIKKIDDSLNKKCFIDVFGKFPIFYSRRKLLSTFFDYKHILANPYDLGYSIVEETRSTHHNIIEYNYGTIVYEEKYYYIFEELSNFKNFNYGYLSSQFIDEKTYLQIINHYLNNQNINNIDTLRDHLYKGKLPLKTILTKEGEV